MPAFHLKHLGRFGNNMFAYAFARAFCERNGHELHMDPWPAGEKIFGLSHPRCDRELPARDEYSIEDTDGDLSYRSYSQQQRCAAYYTVSDCRRWFTFSKEAEYLGEQNLFGVPFHAIAHLRRGDFVPLGYPYPSKGSYLKAAVQFGVDPASVVFVGDDAPGRLHEDPDIPFLPDFYRMCKAKNLFRANSSFSFWPGILNENRVFSPIIDGLPGGEHDCQWVEGTWPKLANFEFTTDLKIGS